MKRNPQARKPSNPIADEINIALPNDGGMWVPNPHWVAELPEPAWARLGRMRAIYEKLKAANDSWSKVPSENRALMEAQAGERGAKLPRAFVAVTVARMRTLSWAVEAEIGEMARRLTAKGVVRDADVVLLLTTRCGLTLAEAKSTPRHEAAALLYALRAPATIADDKTLTEKQLHAFNFLKELPEGEGRNAKQIAGAAHVREATVLRWCQSGERGGKPGILFTHGVRHGKCGYHIPH